MKTLWTLFQWCVFAVVLSSCGPMSPEQQYIRQKIPVELQRGKSLIVKIDSLSGNGINDVGIKCSPEAWNVLTNGTKVIEVRLKASNKPNTKICGVDPTSSGTAFLGYIPDTHYLFCIAGEHRANALVEIAFPNAPEGITRAEIIMCKTPIDTKL